MLSNSKFDSYCTLQQNRLILKVCCFIRLILMTEFEKNMIILIRMDIQQRLNDYFWDYFQKYHYRVNDRTILSILCESISFRIPSKSRGQWTDVLPLIMPYSGPYEDKTQCFGGANIMESATLGTSSVQANVNAWVCGWMKYNSKSLAAVFYFELKAVKRDNG